MRHNLQWLAPAAYSRLRSGTARNWKTAPMRPLQNLAIFVAGATSAGFAALTISAARNRISVKAQAITSLLHVLRLKSAKPPTIEDQTKAGVLSKLLRPSPSRKFLRRFDVTEELVSGARVFTIRPLHSAPGPVILLLHGGSYTQEFSPFHWNQVAGLVAGTAATVIVPLYPLAPLHDWQPAFALLDQLWRSICSAHGGQPVFLAGDSAGGGLALAFAQCLRDSRLALPVAIVLLSPWLDVTIPEVEQQQIDKHDPLLGIATLRECGRRWAGELSLTDPRISPVYGSMKELPPIYVQTSDNDLLMPDSVRLQKAARAVGTTVQLCIYPGMVHDWSLLKIPEGKRALQEASEFINDTALRFYRTDATFNVVGVKGL